MSCHFDRAFLPTTIQTYGREWTDAELAILLVSTVGPVSESMKCAGKMYMSGFNFYYPLPYHLLLIPATRLGH